MLTTQKGLLKETLIVNLQPFKNHQVELYHQSWQSPSHGWCGSPPQGGQPLLLQVSRQFWMNAWFCLCRQ